MGKLIILLLFPVWMMGQSVHPYLGAKAYKLTDQYQRGIDSGVGVLFEGGEELGWIAGARMTYNAVYPYGLDTYKSLAFRGSAGIQSPGDVKIGLSLGANYLANMNTEAAGDALGMDFAGHLQFKVKRFEIYAEAQMGTTFNALVVGGKKSVPYVGAGIGVKFKFESK